MATSTPYSQRILPKYPPVGPWDVSTAGRSRVSWKKIATAFPRGSSQVLFGVTKMVIRLFPGGALNQRPAVVG